MRFGFSFFVLAWFFAAVTAQASDVRSFDFRGIKMGMTLEEVTNLVGGQPVEKIDSKYKFIKSHELSLKEEDESGTSSLLVVFDSEGKAFQINSTQYISERRNLRKLFDVIFEKYGLDPATENGKIIDDASTRENRKWVQDICNCAEMIIDTEVLRSQDRTRITVVMIDTEIRDDNDRANRKRYLELEALRVQDLKGGEGVKL